MTTANGQDCPSPVELALIAASLRFRTPFLVIDMAAARRNIDKMSEIVRGRRVWLRPHYKAHKCPVLMRRQLAAPQTVGATCQTVEEAFELAELGCSDILLTNQLIDPRAAASFVDLPPGVKLSVLIDAPEQVGVIGDAAISRGRDVTVYIEVNVGLGRGGFNHADDRVTATLERIESHSHLVLGGVQAYEGHTVLIADPGSRARRSAEAHAQASDFRDKVVQLVGRQVLLTGGGTGTAEQIAQDGALDEIQCGSYVLMDAAYTQLGLPFESALFCVATVLSAHPDGRVLLDAGMKSMSGDGPPTAVLPALEVAGMSDEHTRALQGSTVVQAGDRVLLQPWHVDPTMNLHRSVVSIDNDLQPDVVALRGHHQLLG